MAAAARHRTTPKRRITKAQATEIALGVRALVLGNDRYRRALCAELGLGDSEIHVLGHVYRSGPLTPTEIAERLGYGTGSTTAILDRVEEAGYVSRTPHPNDRRRLIVDLTERGQQTMDWINDQTTRRIIDTLGAHSEIDPEVLAEQMRMIGAALRDADVEPAPV